MAKINWLKIGILILMTKFLKALTIVEKVLEQQNIKVEPQLLWVYNPFYQGDERVMKHGNCSVQVFKDPEYAPLSEIVVVNANSRLEMFENVAKNKNQIWIMELLESPVHTKNLNFFDGKINYTASYHADSDLPIPYGFLVENQNSSELAPIFPSEKPKKAVFVASNCWTSNSRSLLVDQLSRHYAIDRLGACGNGRIPRKQLEKSLKTNYRYFLAFENSNCEDYITEKVFTAFKHDLIPIVYGAPKSSYENLLPENSFIFVEDFQSVNDLANYLHKIDQNLTLYNQFLNWKNRYSFKETNFYLRLCAVHQKFLPKTYLSVENWWQNKTCKIVSSLFSWKLN